MIDAGAQALEAARGSATIADVRSFTVAYPEPHDGGNVRSLNLATAVGIVLYEALRQLHDW